MNVLGNGFVNFVQMGSTGVPIGRRIKQATQKKKYPYDSLSGGSGKGGPPIPSAPFVSIAYPYYNDGSLEVASVQHSQTEESQERHDGFQTIEDHVYEEMSLPNSVTHKHALTCCSYLGIVLTSFMGAFIAVALMN